MSEESGPDQTVIRHGKPMSATKLYSSPYSKVGVQRKKTQSSKVVTPPLTTIHTPYYPSRAFSCGCVGRSLPLFHPVVGHWPPTRAWAELARTAPGRSSPAALNRPSSKGGGGWEGMQWTTGELDGATRSDAVATGSRPHRAGSLASRLWLELMARCREIRPSRVVRWALPPS